LLAARAAIARSRRTAIAERSGGLLGTRFGPPVMDYDKPRGAPTGGGELTEKERQALDLYVITPRALPGVMHMIDMQNKTDALTAFHEKGSVVEPFEDAMGGGPFGNQHGFTCEDDCWVTTIEDEQTPAKRGYLVIACVRFHTELRPLLDLYLWLAGKTFQWCDGEASAAGVTPDMSLTFGEDGELITSNESEPSTWEISGASTAVIHCFAQAHELTFSRFRLELESREFVISNSGNASTDNAVLHRGYLKH